MLRSATGIAVGIVRMMRRMRRGRFALAARRSRCIGELIIEIACTNTSDSANAVRCRRAYSARIDGKARAEGEDATSAVNTARAFGANA